MIKELHQQGDPENNVPLTYSIYQIKRSSINLIILLVYFTKRQFQKQDYFRQGSLYCWWKSTINAHIREAKRVQITQITAILFLKNSHRHMISRTIQSVSDRKYYYFEILGCLSLESRSKMSIFINNNFNLVKQVICHFHYWIFLFSQLA